MNATKFSEIVEFIEKMYNIRLYDYQKKMLQYMTQGKKFSAPVYSGRKTVLNGYIAYLQDIHGKHIAWHESEEHITLPTVLEENSWIKNRFLGEEKVEQFKREYECIWSSESK